MQWFFIALGAPFLWGLANVSDKFLVTKHSGKSFSSPGSLVLFSSLVGVLVAAVIAIFSHIIPTTLLDKFLLILAGALGVLSIIFYFLALAIEDVSAIVPWMLTIPVFGYIIGYFLLGEILTLRQIIGAVIVLFGVAVLSIDFIQFKLIFKTKIAVLMILSSIFYAFNGVVFKFVAIRVPFWSASFWEYVGLGLGGVCVFIFISPYRRSFIENIKENGFSIFYLNMASESTTILGNLLTNFALLLAPVAMVYLVGTFQPVVVILYTFICTKFFPSIVTENFSREVFIPKVVAILIIIFGSAILFL